MPSTDCPRLHATTTAPADLGLSALVVLDVDEETTALAELRAEFPSVAIARVAARPVASIDADAWLSRASVDRHPFDDAVALAARDGTLGIGGHDPERVARAGWEILTAYQRLVGRRNRWSRTATFDAVLRAHTVLHASDKPLVVADHRHALDTWQWLLRLEPDASFAAQVAALYHDVERLVSEADRRIEHLAADYDAFKDAHARHGAAMTCEVLESLGVSRADRDRVGALLACHERAGSADPELRAVVDADALSFFSLNSPGYVDYFGADQARRKVRWTLARLSPPRRRHLARVRLRDDVRSMVDAAMRDASDVVEHPVGAARSAPRGETGA